MMVTQSNKTGVDSYEGRYKRGLDSLFHISNILSSGSGRRETLSAVLDLMDSEMGMQRGTILLLSPDGKELMTEVAHNLSAAQFNRVRYKYGEGIVGKVIESGKPIAIPRVSQEPMFLDKLHKRGRKDADEEISFICVPISIGKDVIGVMSVDQIFDATTELDETVMTLSVIAGMIANDVHARREAEIMRQELENENVRLREQLEGRFRPENIIGNSGAMQEIYQQIHQVAPSDATVLIRGESGTGKELVAHAIHYASPRSHGPFVKVNCAALSENLIESELFGHKKGAFTGAVEDREGRIEMADGGTLFLDEIGDFTPSTQVKLLRVLQEREFERVGSNESIKTNVRIICATHRDLEQLTDTEEFRQDLFYRINVFPIVMPPLRERKSDITLLADYFAEKYAERMGKTIRRISTPAINMMTAYHWPGNVRELENSIERAVLLSSDEVIHGHHLPPTLQTSEASGTIASGTLKERMDIYEREILIEALKRTGGNVSKAAANLGTTARIFGYKAKKLGIDYHKYRRNK